jgi:hypothetical protein
MPLAVFLLMAAFGIQTNVTGLQGLAWAAVVVFPIWGCFARLMAYDAYGCSILWCWITCTFMLFDRKEFGGASCSPLPTRNYSRGAL